MLAGKPMYLDITGKLLAFPYTLNIGIVSLEEFLTNNSSWMEIQADISKAKLLLNGNIDLAEAHKSLALKAAVSGESLDTLNDLLQLDLPPFSPYSVEADLFMENQRFELKNLTVKTGSSSLNGTVQITTGEEKAEVVIEFTSPLFQLDDFTFDDWSWTGEDTKAVSPDEATEVHTSAKETAVDVEPSDKTERKLLDPSVLAQLDASLTLRSERVLSGDDELGNGLLKAVVQDGRIAIEPLELQVTGGSIELAASIKPGTKQSDASLKVTMKNFDIGILVRRTKPEAKMGGLINLDVDLQSSAATFDQMLANGNGYLDFSGHLENMNAGIIDLWAVNLIAAIVSRTDENQSQINCAIGRWSVKDCLLTPDVFFIDTSKIRICGTGSVDFKKQRIDLNISPVPKRPEFFNLATPMEVHGTFSDIGLGFENLTLIGTTLKFITSPVTVPIKRVFSEDIPEDGSDACVVVLGPDNRSESSVDGCR